jgi:hypothetical protein
MPDIETEARASGKEILMFRHFNSLMTLAAAALLSGLPATAADQPKAAAAAQAPVLSAADTAKLNRLKALPQPDARLTLTVGPALNVPLKPAKVKKEISCGIYVYPPNPNPLAVSPRLFFVNTTGQILPAGTHIDWEVLGNPPSCCKGEGTATVAWAANPPSPVFLPSGPVVVPPQPWTRECKAWVTMP